MNKYYAINNLFDENGDPITITFENKYIMKINKILNNINTKYEDYYVQDIVSGDDLKLLLDYIIKIRKYYNANVNKYEDLLVKYSIILDENNKLQSNWNSLNEWITNENNKYHYGLRNGKTLLYGKFLGRVDVLDKMNELESGEK